MLPDSLADWSDNVAEVLENLTQNEIFFEFLDFKGKPENNVFLSWEVLVDECQQYVRIIMNSQSLI